jgi:hypothetical protein
MAQAMNESACADSSEDTKGDQQLAALNCKCPLCEEEISLDIPDRRVPAKWLRALAYRDKWGNLSAEFHASRSIEDAAQRLSLTVDEARFLLDFLCTEVCGCRLVTCVSCLDDYRSEL